MRLIFVILALSVIAACNQAPDAVPPKLETASVRMNTSYLPQDTVDEAEADPYDSLKKALVDTTTLKGKRKWIMNQFISEHVTTTSDDDTLFDLTYDGVKDYVIHYYGMAGTGIKNRIEVYLYNKRCGCYIRNEQLSDLPNPTFYMRQKKITGFYIGNGGGGGGQLEWINNTWRVTKEFSVNGDGDSTKWMITYPLRRRTEVKVQPLQMIPPANILDTDIKW